MSTLQQVAFYDVSSAPKTDAVPVFDTYKTRAGVDRTPPSFVSIGVNEWSFEPTDADEAIGVVYVISGGAGAYPALQFGVVHVPSEPFAAALFTDSSGALWAGSAPTLGNYQLLDNGAAADPSVVTVSTGLYSVTPTGPQLDAGGVGYRLDAPASALPAFYTGDLAPGGSSTPPPSTVVPVVGNFTPARPGPIGPLDEIGFDVTISDGTDFANLGVSVDLEGLDTVEEAYDGATFAPLYAGSSSAVAITNGFQFSLKRRGGWPANPIVKVRAISASGVINV